LRHGRPRSAARRRGPGPLSVPPRVPSPAARAWPPQVPRWARGRGRDDDERVRPGREGGRAARRLPRALPRPTGRRVTPDVGVGVAPGRLDVLGGVADYGGALVLPTPTAARTTVDVASTGGDE